MDNSGIIVENVRPVIPVVFAADEQYVPYLGVALTSLIQFTTVENEYRIYILNNGLSTHRQKKLKQLERENIKIYICDISDLMKGKKIRTIAHFTAATAYRLLIDQLFLEYKKILYIDSDIIFRQDIAKLYQTDIGENILGAVRGRLFPFSVKYIQNELKLDMKDYFNAGVLIINIEMFRKYEIGKKGMRMLSEKTYQMVDQDVLNILCVNHVQFIDGRWNVEWEHLTESNGLPVIDEVRRGSLEYVKDPYIIHYTSPIKPWAHPEIELADYFWNCARQTPFYEEILYQNTTVQNSESQEIWHHFLFPWGSVEPHKKIILYGFGNVGHILYEQVKKTNYCNIVAICDKRAISEDGLSVPLIQIESIGKFEFDYVVIAAAQEKVAADIWSDLAKAGVPSKKIVWENPAR